MFHRSMFPPPSARTCVIETLGSEDHRPHERSGHCCATDGANLYVFGGYHPEVHVSTPGIQDITHYNHIFTDLWCYNLSLRKWMKLETTGEPPQQTASMSMLLSGNTLILFGGTIHPWGIVSNDQIYTLHLGERKWRVMNCTGSIPGKYGQAMVMHQATLYVFGGCQRLSEEEHFFDSQLFQLDMRTKEWSSLLTSDHREDATLAHNRGMYRHGLAFYDNKLYVIGSSWEELWHLLYFEKIHVFNLETMRWSWEPTIPSEESSSPQRRAYHSCVQWKSEVYMCGGHDHQQVLDDIWCLHLPELRWQKIHTTLPQKTFFHAASITETKCMYLFGGVKDLDERVRTSIVQRVWLDIPSLSELCWHQVLAQSPNLSTMSREQLVTLGIPRTFVERLSPIR
ncbi:kelch domain-containing protein 10-like [Diadema antillarum]|uniref:kelch domain-containing protein 10-like n=2 Tax=Diadema antillarum TaxID=105358 RepID=UPI003A84C2AD